MNVRRLQYSVYAVSFLKSKFRSLSQDVFSLNFTWKCSHDFIQQFLGWPSKMWPVGGCFWVKIRYCTQRVGWFDVESRDRIGHITFNVMWSFDIIIQSSFKVDLSSSVCKWTKTTWSFIPFFPKHTKSCDPVFLPEHSYMYVMYAIKL